MDGTDAALVLMRVDSGASIAEGAGMSTFEASGVITLTTDFGHKGPFVASMKGVMVSHFPTAKVIDLTHEILEHWPAEAGFWLERSYKYFPRGTVHMAVVDPGVGTSRHILAAEHDGHVFIAPDNGLLTPMLEIGVDRVHAIDIGRLGKIVPSAPSATFHGRDIFAPVTAEIAAGRLRVEQVGPAVKELVPSWVEPAEVVGDEVRGMVIAVDNFGNLITNVGAELIEAFEQASVHVGGADAPLLRTYADKKPGEYLGLINSFGVLEVARAEKSAADDLGVSRGAPVTVRRK